MARPTQLHVHDVDGGPIPHTLWRGEPESRHLGVILPGEAYGADLPLLYFPRRQLLERGADVLVSRRIYAETAAYRAAAPERRRAIVAAEARALIAAAFSQRACDRLTIVAKSVATLATAGLLANGHLPVPPAVVWLTPLLRHRSVLTAIECLGTRSLVVIGTADPEFGAAPLDRARDRHGVRVMTIAGANHALEVPGAIRSVSILAEVLAAIELFLDG